MIAPLLRRRSGIEKANMSGCGLEIWSIRLFQHLSELLLKPAQYLTCVGFGESEMHLGHETALARETC